MNKIDLIRCFVKSVDKNIDVESDNRFCVDIDAEIVFVPQKLNDREDEVWSNFLKEEFKVDYNSYVMSVLHEIGHIETYTEDLNTERELIYFLLQMKYEEDNFEDFNNEYFKIPMEYIATEWAIDFYKNNMGICEKLVNDLKGCEI